MMLGGVDENGNSVFCTLSELCLEASYNNKLIDPKINLRVGKDTPEEVYTKASHLTKAGLGFPQYSNDDVVIPALEQLGYAHEDAANYTVAACWEFIISFVGADVANIGAVSYAKAIDVAFHHDLPDCATYEDFFAAVQRRIWEQCDDICAGLKNLWFVPSPFMHVLMDCDIYTGGKYNNYGIHGTGIATAADSLAAIRKYIYEDKSLTKAAYIKAVDEDFAHDPELLHTLRYDSPKLGNNDDSVDAIAVALLDTLADALAGRQNDRGGCYRAGTGSAMYYLWHGRELPATCDGRRAGEPLSANFTPSLTCGSSLPLSAVRAMARPGLNRVMNGGPLTLELHDSLFRTPEGTQKTAQLVRTFIQLGGHQLQLNAVSPETLQDAMLHPEAHRNLIVRVWGWSGRFVELDREYQDQILHRVCYSQE